MNTSLLVGIGLFIAILYAIHKIGVLGRLPTMLQAVVFFGGFAFTLYFSGDVYPQWARENTLKKHLGIQFANCNNLDVMYNALYKRLSRTLPHQLKPDAYALKKLARIYQPPIGDILEAAGDKMLECGWEDLSGY